MMSDAFAQHDILDRQLQVTVWHNNNPKKANGGVTTMRALAEHIQKRHAQSKMELYWLKLSTFGNIYSPKGSLRNNNNVQSVSGLEADYDGGEYGFDWAVLKATKANIGCLVYTSPSHTPDNPRWRVLAPFSEDLDPSMRRVLMGRLNGAFGGIFSGESWTLSQSYFYGYVDGNEANHRVELVDGEAIDLLHDLDKVWMDKPNTKPRYETEGNEDGAPVDLSELDVEATLNSIRTGQVYHPAIRAIAAKFIAEGKKRHEVYSIIMEAGEQVPAEFRDRRWQDRFSPHHVNSILDWVITNEKKKLFTPYYDGEYVDPPPRSDPEDEARTEQARTSEERAQGPSGRLLISAAEFVSGFTPPEYLIDGIVQRGYLYSLTARTGHGKTAVDMYLCQCVARGLKVQRHDVEQGSILFLAGENPDDIRARYLVLSDKFGFEPAEIPFNFVNGVIDVEKSLARIQAESKDIPNLKLVVVDTAAAYYKGDDGNSNTQQGSFARVLRQLTFLPGLPAVIVNCHPVKNATKDNLLPMGGSAFLNEVDGNLTLWADTDEQTTLHWQGKFRGPEFEPITFKMETATSDLVRDTKGRHMPSVVAKPISEMEIEVGLAHAETDENILLAIIANNRPLSLAQLGIKANWLFTDGRPAKSKVQKTATRLLADNLIAKGRAGKFKATPAGRKELGYEDE